MLISLAGHLARPSLLAALQGGSCWLHCKGIVAGLLASAVSWLIKCMMATGVQDCLSFGKPLLIENIEEELDPVLDPVLERRYVKKGRGYTVALADKEVCQLASPCSNRPYK